jgi:hypothetical protein
MGYCASQLTPGVSYAVCCTHGRLMFVFDATTLLLCVSRQLLLSEGVLPSTAHDMLTCMQRMDHKAPGYHIVRLACF